MTGNRLIQPVLQALDAQGNAIEGATLTFYANGTDTLQATYQDAALTLINTNPVVSKESGYFPPIFLQQLGYTVVYDDQKGGTWTADNVSNILQIDFTGVVTADTVADLTALVKATLTDQEIRYVHWRTTKGDGGGGLFYWDEGSTAATNLGTIFQADAGGAGRWMRLDKDTVHVNWFGAVAYDSKADAEAGTDSASAIQAAWTYARDNGLTVVHQPNKFYLAQSVLETQPDVSFAPIFIEGRDSTIVKDHAGVGVLVEGGTSFQEVNDLTVEASTNFAASDFLGTYNASTHVITPSFNEHGFHIINTRVRLRNCRAHLNRGAGFRVESTAANSNKSEYHIQTTFSGMAGIYISGTNNNISVIRSQHLHQFDYGPGVHVEDDVNWRDWDSWIYCESCCGGASAAGAGLETQVYIGKSTASRIWLYSENQAGFDEFHLGPNADRSRVTSVRANLDYDLSTAKTNSWIYGHRRYYPGNVGDSRQGEPLEIHASRARVGTGGEWCRVPFTGSGGTYGYVKGEVDYVGFQSPAGEEIKLNDNEARVTPDLVVETLISLESGSVTISAGAGTPEGAITANPGSLFLRSDGGAGASLYVKESGAGNTGWVAK